MTKTMIRKLPTKVKMMIEARTYNFVDRSFPSSLSCSLDSATVEFMLKYRKILLYRKPMKTAEQIDKTSDWIGQQNFPKPQKGQNRSLLKNVVLVSFVVTM